MIYATTTIAIGMACMILAYDPTLALTVGVGVLVSWVVVFCFVKLPKQEGT